MATPRSRRKPGFRVSTRALCVRYCRIYTGAITDVLDKRGDYDPSLPHDDVPLTPETRLGGIAHPGSGKQSRNNETDACAVSSS